MRVLFILSILITFLFAESSVWRASKDGYVFYLGGAVHILSYKDYPLPKEFSKAYSLSNTIIFEADITDVDSFSKKLINKMYSNKTLSDILDEKTFARLDDYIEQENIKHIDLTYYKPWAAGLVLMQKKLYDIGLDSMGVDQYFLYKSIEDNKNRVFLESVDEHINVLSSMDNEDPNQYINQVLDDIDNIDEIMEKTLKSWRDGEIDTIEKLLLEPVLKSNQYDVLLKDRNEKWMVVLDDLIEQKKELFVIVGLLHLVGEDSLLKKIEKLGFKIEKL